MLAMSARRGQYADAERLFDDVAAAYREADERWQLATRLTEGWSGSRRNAASSRLPWNACARSLVSPRELGSGDRMADGRRDRDFGALAPATARDAARAVRAPEASARVAWRRGSPVSHRPCGPAGARGPRESPRRGRSLSLERAVDLALRVLEEELAAASAAEVREGGGAAASADTPRRQGR